MPLILQVIAAADYAADAAATSAITPLLRHCRRRHADISPLYYAIFAHYATLTVIELTEAAAAMPVDAIEYAADSHTSPIGCATATQLATLYT